MSVNQTIVARTAGLVSGLYAHRGRGMTMVCVESVALVRGATVARRTHVLLSRPLIQAVTASQTAAVLLVTPGLMVLRVWAVRRAPARQPQALVTVAVVGLTRTREASRQQCVPVAPHGLCLRAVANTRRTAFASWATAVGMAGRVSLAGKVNTRTISGMLHVLVAPRTVIRARSVRHHQLCAWTVPDTQFLRMEATRYSSVSVAMGTWAITILGV